MTVNGADDTLTLYADIDFFFPQTQTPGQDGNTVPFEIDSSTALDALRAAISCGFGASLSYIQTANIDLSGLGTYDPDPSAGTAFSGIYDGGGFKISNVLFTDRTYAGIFNQISGGTIQDLKVEKISFQGILPE